MKQVIKYQCEYCGELFNTEASCFEHEDKHEKINRANQMLKNGCSIKEIQNKCNIWYSIPEHLESVNTYNCFVVSHWQCCNKPAYRIVNINIDGSVQLWGCGSWNGYYGGDVRLNSLCLKNPHPKEELFIDERYSSRW